MPNVSRLLVGHLDEGPDYATWRSRGTDDWLLIHTVSGAGGLSVEGGTVEAATGDSHLLPPRSRHDYGTAPHAEHWEILFAHFHPRTDWIPLLHWPEPVAGIRWIHTAGKAELEIRRSLLRALGFVRSVVDQHELFAINAFEAALLWCHSENPAAPHFDERIERAIALIEERLATHLTVAELARQSSLSVSRFSHLFRQQVGTSPAAFLERQRITRARQLLELTSRPIGSIAAQVGFDNPLYFSTRFRVYTRTTPTEYRARARVRG